MNENIDTRITNISSEIRWSVKELLTLGKLVSQGDSPSPALLQEVENTLRQVNNTLRSKFGPGSNGNRLIGQMAMGNPGPAEPVRGGVKESFVNPVMTTGMLSPPSSPMVSHASPIVSPRVPTSLPPGPSAGPVLPPHNLTVPRDPDLPPHNLTVPTTPEPDAIARSESALRTSAAALENARRALERSDPTRREWGSLLPRRPPTASQRKRSNNSKSRRRNKRNKGSKRSKRSKRRRN